MQQIPFVNADKLHKALVDVLKANRNRKELIEGFTVEELAEFVIIFCSARNTCVPAISPNLADKGTAHHFVLDCYNVAV